MGAKTSIEWTESTWNPIRARIGDRVGWHCEIVTPGCEHCYAEAINHRLGTGDDYLKKSRRAEIFLDEKMLTAPLRWKAPRKIFPCSTTDLFGDWVTDEMLDRIFAVMALCPHHTFQVLTKRAERMRDYLLSWPMISDEPDRIVPIACEIAWGVRGQRGQAGLCERPLPNVWCGVSAEDQRRADERIPLLLETPAVVRFISYEPGLGPVALPPEFLALDKRVWAICGGESGPGARPFEIEWARSIIAQCKTAGVACFVKQLGAVPVIKDEPPFGGDWPEGTHFGNRTGILELNGRCALLRDRKGGDASEWAPDLRVREYPEPRADG